MAAEILDRVPAGNPRGNWAAEERAQQLRDASLTEIERVICERMPTRPSTAADATLPRLRKQLRGDLDNIILKALRKEPDARYPTVTALIDEAMPVVTIAPNDHVFEKMAGNVQEAKARGGSVIALTTADNHGIQDLLDPKNDFLITIPNSHPLLTPVLAVVPLQLLSYHIAVRRGCDVDQPRNLAKSVTVE